MQPNMVINQIFSRSDTLLYLWCLFVIAGLGVLVIVARSTHPSLPRLLFFGFAFFAITHLMCLQWILKQWASSLAALQKNDQWKLEKHDGMKHELMAVLEVPEFGWVLPFHLAFSAFVLFGIWWLSRKRGT